MLSQNVVLKQEQKLKLSPQLFQSIQMMALPLTELRNKIHEEVEKNPALELVRDEKDLSLTEHPTAKETEYDPFENSSDPGYQSRTYSDEDTKRKFLEGTIFSEETLQDVLINQLHLIPELSERELEIGELLIRNLNNDGFHYEDPSKLIPAKDNNILLKMMKIGSARLLHFRFQRILKSAIQSSP